MKRTKVAINGFGRIGRAFFKLVITRPELEVVVINDLGDIDNLAYLLQYDSVYGRYGKEISVKEKDPSLLPWGVLGVDIVVEATGIYDSYEKAEVHKKAGAKRVVITAPSKDEDSESYKTVLMGVNEDDLKTCTISSNGSCTTNSVSPVMQILSEKIGIKKAFLSTTHGYIATQNLIDGPVKGHDWRRGRSR